MSLKSFHVFEDSGCNCVINVDGMIKLDEDSPLSKTYRKFYDTDSKSDFIVEDKYWHLYWHAIIDQLVWKGENNRSEEPTSENFDNVVGF